MSNATTIVSLSWQDPEDFVKDLQTFHKRGLYVEVKDLSGAKMRWKELETELQEERNKVFEEKIQFEGSNVNWGRITQPYMIQGGTVDEPEMYRIKKFEKTDAIIRDMVLKHHINKKEYEEIYETGELTAPLVKVLEEQEEEETLTESSLLCKGCSKLFATKASLKRHHDRKKSCKEISEKKEDISGSIIEVPDKPYIVDWIDQIMLKAISGFLDGVPNEKPYCKHCDVEFANKSNLNKHLSKSVACDKLAKEEFLKIICSKVE